jgi:cephalosporin-C deacetylase-like acetyl esterase
MKSHHGFLCTCLFLLVSAPAVLPAGDDYTVFRSPDELPREQLTRYLNAIGRNELAERAHETARIQTQASAEQRKEAVREKILRLIGGLPDYRGPLNTKNAGVLERGDYRIEKVIFESLPGFYVPANIYVPSRGHGPFPAILMPVGHSDEGKVSGQRQIAIGFARIGFIAMTYDPIGQGERALYYDPDLGASKVGGCTDQHSHMNGSTTLIGDNVARYRIWDGMRAIDYLLSRQDVDAQRIGCTGCSGGGTLTTYISALDDRVKVAAPACYMTSWKELLAGPGPQDGEQSFAQMLSEGLDEADFVELFAPKPWLIASTIEDFFPLEGARQTFEEAKRIYGLYGAGDRVDWFVGPGGHGVPEPSRRAIYAWFIKWFNGGKGNPVQPIVKLEPPEALLCTKTGQVWDSLKGKTLFAINKKRAAELIPGKPAIATEADVDAFRTRVISAVEELAGITIKPGGPAPSVTVHRTIIKDDHTIQIVSYSSERGIEIPGLLLVPDASGRKPAVLVVDTRPNSMIAAPAGDLEDLVKAGFLIFSIKPRGVAEGPVSARPSFIGDYISAFRAYVVGKTLVGMRAEDIIRAVDYLSSRQDVDAGRISTFGQGTLGPTVLHAAVMDKRIGSLILQQSLARCRMAVERPIHRNLYEVAIPGMLRKYDLDDLLVVLSPRPVTIINPVDAMGHLITHLEFREQCRFAFDVGAKLGTSDRVRLAYRGSREALSQFMEK